jgi:hypothetical protein
LDKKVTVALKPVNMIRRSPAPDAVALAEDCFRKSLELANHQGALSSELRTATSLARLRRDQGQVDDARNPAEQWKPSHSSQCTIQLNLLAAQTEDR